MRPFPDKFSPMPTKRSEKQALIFIFSFSVFMTSWLVFPRTLNADLTINFPLNVLQNPTTRNERIIFSNLRDGVMTGLFASIDKFLDIPEQFSSDYGNGQSLASHLNSPIGSRVLQRGSILIGFGVGIALPKGSEALALSESSRDVDSLPFGVLPTLGLAVNTGLGITHNWDIRLSYFPVSDIALPNLFEILIYRFRSGVIRVATNYRLLGQDQTLFSFGLMLGAYFTHSTGAAAFNGALSSINISSGDDAGAPLIRLSFDSIQFNTKWENYSGGAELRLDYKLFFFLPYLGFGLGLEYGRTDSVLQLNGTLNADIVRAGLDINFVDESGVISIFGDARTATVPFRIIAGFELNFYKLSIILEAQYFVNASVLGVSFGINLLI